MLQSSKKSSGPSPKPKCLVGDEALDELVLEEYKQNSREERERLLNA